VRAQRRFERRDGPRTIPGVLNRRDPERARPGALLEAARLSRSGAALIRSEPGIGKSRRIPLGDEGPGSAARIESSVEAAV
jgi:hypothetical protein